MTDSAGLKGIRENFEQPPTKNIPLLIFGMIDFINFFRIGYQLLISAWFAVQITKEASSIGLLLLASSVTTLVISPFAGKIIDFVARKRLILVLGSAGVALSGIVPTLAYVTGTPIGDFKVLILTTCLVTAAGFFASGPLDYFLKTYVSPSGRLAKLASLNMVTQFAFIAGTTTAGGMIVFLSPYAAFLGISLCAAISGIACLIFLPDLILPATRPMIQSKPVWFAGPLLYAKHFELFCVACCSALVFSVGQVTNTLLPALVNITMKRGSVSYSTAETAWSLGAFILSASVARRTRQSIGRTPTDLLLIATMACVLLSVPFLPSFNGLLIAHFGLGIGFAFVRLRSESRFLILCPTHLLGQFRSNSQFLTSLLGLVIFGAPVVLVNLSVPTMYVLLSGTVLFSAVLVFAIEKRRRRALVDPVQKGYGL